MKMVGSDIRAASIAPELHDSGFGMVRSFLLFGCTSNAPVWLAMRESSRFPPARSAWRVNGRARTTVSILLSQGPERAIVERARGLGLELQERYRRKLGRSPRR